jgi:hypothetical protein
MSTAYHHDIYINAPKQIAITKEQFDRISYIGIASLFCNYPGIIIERDSIYEVYMKEYRAYNLFLLKEAGQKRFEGLRFVKYGDAEMGSIEVPKEHPLAKTLQRYFRHLIAR